MYGNSMMTVLAPGVPEAGGLYAIAGKVGSYNYLRQIGGAFFLYPADETGQNICLSTTLGETTHCYLLATTGNGWGGSYVGQGSLAGQTLTALDYPLFEQYVVTVSEVAEAGYLRFTGTYLKQAGLQNGLPYFKSADGKYLVSSGGDGPWELRDSVGTSISVQDASWNDARQTSPATSYVETGNYSPVGTVVSRLAVNAEDYPALPQSVYLASVRPSDVTATALQVVDLGAEGVQQTQHALASGAGWLTLSLRATMDADFPMPRGTDWQTNGKVALVSLTNNAPNIAPKLRVYGAGNALLGEFSPPSYGPNQYGYNAYDAGGTAPRLGHHLLGYVGGYPDSPTLPCHPTCDFNVGTLPLIAIEKVELVFNFHSTYTGTASAYVAAGHGYVPVIHHRSADSLGASVALISASSTSAPYLDASQTVFSQSATLIPAAGVHSSASPTCSLELVSVVGQMATFIPRAHTASGTITGLTFCAGNGTFGAGDILSYVVSGGTVCDGTYAQSGTYNEHPAYTNGVHWLFYEQFANSWMLAASKGGTMLFAAWSETLAGEWQNYETPHPTVTEIKTPILLTLDAPFSFPYAADGLFAAYLVATNSAGENARSSEMPVQIHTNMGPIYNLIIANEVDYPTVNGLYTYAGIHNDFPYWCGPEGWTVWNGNSGWLFWQGSESTSPGYIFPNSGLYGDLQTVATGAWANSVSGYDPLTFTFVENAPPLCALALTGHSELTATFTVTASDTQGLAEIMLYFGDGVSQTVSAGQTVSHSYPFLGAFSAFAVARDASGAATASNSVPVTLGGAPPPSCHIDAHSISQRTLTITPLAAAVGDATLTDVTAQWATGVSTPGCVSGQPVSHSYPPSGGTFTVSCTATDSNGVSANSDTLSVVIDANVAPSCSFTATLRGRALTVNANASSDGDGAIAAWRLQPKADADWVAGSVGQPTRYVYAATDREVLLTVEVTDNEGASAQQTLPLTIALPNARRRHVPNLPPAQRRVIDAATANCSVALSLPQHRRALIMHEISAATSGGCLVLEAAGVATPVGDETLKSASYAAVLDMPPEGILALTVVDGTHTVTVRYL
ncbi:MAG TPA: hypothetical protein VGL77_09880 [Armatimonadota bacterium]|jgi:hypothetical protein